MVWFDIVLRGTCHDICGIIAVQHSQFNVVWQGTKTTIVALLLLAAFPAVAGTIAKPSKPDPLLDGGPTAPCAAGADYAAGADANGAPVVPADVGAQPVPVPDGIMVPVGGGQGRRGRGTINPATGAGNGPYVALDGRKLAPLLNPQPCRN
jgi:hypothetical protein